MATNPDKPGTYMLTIGIKDIEKFYTETKKLYDAGTPMVAWLDFEEGVDSYTDASIPDHCGAGSNTHCISIAYINGELTGDSVQLTGNFTQQEAEDLANLLNSGSLPTKMEEISSRTVDHTFGDDALHKTFLAGVVGIIIIILFLTAVYRFSGVITGVGILIYTALVFLIFNLLGARLTLPSIAAVVIGIGMAVDACIISFSRIKEELREKKTLEEAFKKGNKNSLSSILDANITTLIAAVMLFNKRTGSVKGFATMLIISIFVTLFVMVYLMRILLGMFVKSGIFEGHYRAFLGMKSLEKKDTSKVNLAKWMPRLFTATVVILVVGGICSYFRGFHMGIDFQGGSSITIQSTDTLEAVKLEKDLTELQYDVARVEIFNDDHSAYITLSDFVDKDDEVEIKKVFAKYSDVATDISAISNLEKEKLIRNAIESLIYACLGLILYVTLRFTFSYGISAVCALIHDVAIVIIAFSLFHLEVSSIFVAAILSIIGYSINDTIVAFDRIRENKKKLYHNQIKTKEELKELVQVTLKEVIGRSLLTSITTLIPVIALIFLGSREILTFNYALLIGLIAGTYSSLFVALQLWYILERKNVGKKEKKKWYEVDDKDDVEELKVKGINC